MHKVLERQLRHLGIPLDSEAPISAEKWRGLLARVEAAYTNADQDRYTLERSIALSSAEMKDLHQKLASERDKLRALIGCLGDGLLVTDQNQRVELVNSEAERLLGWRSDELLGRSLTEVLLREPDSGPAESLRERIARAEPCRGDDARFATAGGASIPVAFAFNPIVHERGVQGATMIFRDISDRLAAERARNESEARLRSIFDSAALGIFRLDPRGAILDANPAAVRMFGLTREALSGRTLADLFDARRAVAVAPRADGASAALERQYAHPDGTAMSLHLTETWVRDPSGAIQFGTTIVEDVTATRELEGSLRHAQKLESVGRLASGIAHEINTPIQFVNDNVHFLQGSFETVTSFVDALRSLVRERAPGLAAEADAADLLADWDYLGVEIPKSITQTLDGLKRVETIVQSMKAFAHNDRGVQGLTDLNAALANTLTVAIHEMKDVAVATESFGDIPEVLCSRGDLSQVFLTLVVNAVHAIEDVVKDTGRLGRITVSTRRDGDDVVISIADTGAGIPEAVRGHIFEPFFTTKEVGRGTGQGLAHARSVVVQKHGGGLTFETEPGVGTTFYIRLPIAGARQP